MTLLRLIKDFIRDLVPGGFVRGREPESFSRPSDWSKTFDDMDAELNAIHNTVINMAVPNVSIAGGGGGSGGGMLLTNSINSSINAQNITGSITAQQLGTFTVNSGYYITGSISQVSVSQVSQLYVTGGSSDYVLTSVPINVPNQAWYSNTYFTHSVGPEKPDIPLGARWKDGKVWKVWDGKAWNAEVIEELPPPDDPALMAKRKFNFDQVPLVPETVGA